MPDLGPEVPPDDLPEIPTVAKLKIPPGKIDLGPEVPPEDLPELPAGVSGPRPPTDTLKAGYPGWLEDLDEGTRLAAQVGGEKVGMVGGGLLGGLAGTVEAPGVGTVEGAEAGAGAGAIAGAGTAQVAQAYTMNALKRLLGYNPESVDPKEQFEAGAVSSGVGRILLPAAMKYAGIPLVRNLTGVSRVQSFGDEAAAAAQEDLNTQATITGTKYQKVQDTAEEAAAKKWAADAIQSRAGKTASEGAGELASTMTPEGQAAFAMQHRAMQKSAVDAANRSFEKTGQQIGDVWEPYRQVGVNTSHFTDTVDEILHPPAGTKPPGAISKPVSDLLEKFNVSGMQNTDQAGNILDMDRDARLLQAKTKSPCDQFALARMREQLTGILTDDEVLPPEARAQLAPLKATYAAKKDWITGSAFTALKGSANPADTFEKLVKLPHEGFNAIVMEATPEELTTLREGSADWIAGRDPNNAKGILDRVDKFYSDNPEGYKALWKGTPMEDPRILARTPMYALKMSQAMHYPKFQGYYQQAFQEQLETPEMQQLSKELTKYYQMPSPEAARMPGAFAMMRDKNPDGGMMRYLKRRLGFDAIVFGVSGGTYGMMSHRPMISVALGGILASREFMLYGMMKHPEAYWKYVSAIGAGMTSEGAKAAGKYGASLAMLYAIDAMHQKARTAQAAATTKPEPVTGVPTTDPSAVAMP